jgi:hypothetical protein
MICWLRRGAPVVGRWATEEETWTAPLPGAAAGEPPVEGLYEIDVRFRQLDITGTKLVPARGT